MNSEPAELAVESGSVKAITARRLTLWCLQLQVLDQSFMLDADCGTSVDRGRAVVVPASPGFTGVHRSAFCRLQEGPDAQHVCFRRRAVVHQDEARYPRLSPVGVVEQQDGQVSQALPAVEQPCSSRPVHPQVEPGISTVDDEPDLLPAKVGLPGVGGPDQVVPDAADVTTGPCAAAAEEVLLLRPKVRDLHRKRGIAEALAVERLIVLEDAPLQVEPGAR